MQLCKVIAQVLLCVMVAKHLGFVTGLQFIALYLIFDINLNLHDFFFHNLL